MSEHTRTQYKNKTLEYLLQNIFYVGFLLLHWVGVDFSDE